MCLPDVTADLLDLREDCRQVLIEGYLVLKQSKLAPAIVKGLQQLLISLRLDDNLLGRPMGRFNIAPELLCLQYPAIDVWCTLLA